MITFQINLVINQNNNKAIHLLILIILSNLNNPNNLIKINSNNNRLFNNNNSIKLQFNNLLNSHLNQKKSLFNKKIYLILWMNKFNHLNSLYNKLTLILKYNKTSQIKI